MLREVGEAGRTGKDHLELAGERIDTERGARLSGARFAYLRGDVVRLEFALVHWALDKLAERGFEPVIPPVLVREEALYGTGFLPDTEQQIYRLADDDLYLVGTSEVPLASLHADEIVDGLPLRYAGLSSCFRRETFLFITASSSRNDSYDFSRRAKPTTFSTEGRSPSAARL